MTKQQFKYGGIIIDKLNSTDLNVPNDCFDIDLPLADKKALAIAINNDLPTLLIGETGTGKTNAIKQLAFLRQQPYVRANLNGFTDPDNLIGTKSVKDGATYFENGIVTNAMQIGAILVLDEINATTPDCLFILHGLLDDDKRITLPNGEIIRPHKDFRIFATCNPDYEGTKSMNKAFIDRFPIILAIDTLNYKKEAKLLQDRTAIDEITATNLVSIATLARKDYTENKISSFVSTRSLLNIGELIKNGLTPKEAYTTTIVRKTNNQEEQAILKDFYNLVMKTNEANDNPDKPIITNQAEIDQFIRQIDSLKSDNDAFYKQRNEAQDKLIEAQEQLKELEALKQRDKTQSETIDQLSEKIKNYKQLEETIAKFATTQTQTL
jgi:MoxR-like ATPase